MKRVVLLALVLGVAAVVAGNAGAAETHSNCIQFDGSGNVIGLTPNCSQTISQKGGTPIQMPAVDPCTNETGILTLAISHQVYHINVDGAGDAWDTGTQSGTASFAPDDGTGPTAEGTWVNWFGDSFNAQNLVQSFTTNVSLALSNGQRATFHEVGHVTFTPNGPAVSFDKPTPTCS
jgi:hypothetical protein